MEENNQSSSGILSQISSFKKESLKETTTRVRTRDGRLFEENIKEGKSEFKGTESIPSFLEANEKGYAELSVWKFDKQTNNWRIRTNNEQPMQELEFDKLSFITFNVWFDEFHWEDRAIELFKIISKRNQI